MTSKTMTREDVRAFALLSAGGALLRLVMFNARSLWFDEAITLRLASLPWAEIWGRAVYMEATPPLHPFLVKAWSAAFSDPLVGARSLSWLCGTLSLPLFFALARRLCGERWRTAALLGAASSFWVHLSQDGRCYALLQLLVLAHAWLFLDLLERPGPRRAGLYALAGAAGLYTHNFFALVLVSHGAWALWRGGRARWAWLAAVSASALAWLPWAPCFLRQLEVWKGVTLPVEPLNARTALDIVGTMVFDPTFLGIVLGRLIPGIGLCALLVVAGGLVRGSRREGAGFALAMFVLPFAGAFAVGAVIGHSVAQTRYLVVASPWLYLLLTDAVHAWGERTARLLRPTMILVAAAGAATYFASARWVDPRLGRLASAVRLAAGTGGIVVHLDPYYYLPMRYYYLPDLVHYLPAGTRKLTDWGGHPGYPAILAPGGLERLGRVVVLDPRKTLFPSAIGIAEGPGLARALGR